LLLAEAPLASCKTPDQRFSSVDFKRFLVTWAAWLKNALLISGVWQFAPPLEVRCVLRFPDWLKYNIFHQRCDVAAAETLRVLS
jgi:hypothetical protein